ncbi:MAG: cupin domain-containing protein [Candidatus Bipolaricaulota bacterium]|nr:cupin domain-containing protein [Candidatus Bipolaricaulota bacterium]
MRVQHLVLDDDVHKALKAHKGRTGVTVREIGNAALRAALALPTPDELALDKLVATGKLTREEYERARAEAERELRARLARLGKGVIPPEGRAVRVGSWEVRSLGRKEGAYEVLLYQARDGKKLPSPLHHHEGSHLWAYVVRGRVAAQVGEETALLEAHESAHVAPRVAHAFAPLARGTTMVVFLAPPEEKPTEGTAAGAQAPKRGRGTRRR